MVRDDAWVDCNTFELPHIDATRLPDVDLVPCSPDLCVYHPYALAHHRGDTDAGHIWSTVRLRDGTWVNCDDSTVTPLVTSPTGVPTADISVVFLRRGRAPKPSHTTAQAARTTVLPEGHMTAGYTRLDDAVRVPALRVYAWA